MQMGLEDPALLGVNIQRPRRVVSEAPLILTPLAETLQRMVELEQQLQASPGLLLHIDAKRAH